MRKVENIFEKGFKYIRGSFRRSKQSKSNESKRTETTQTKKWSEIEIEVGHDERRTSM
jgi:hypothetical protein